jgi:hypothetical protein
MNLLEIEILRHEIAKACEYVEKRGGVITTGSWGTTSNNLEVVEGCCYCPIGALELLRGQPRDFFNFDYDPFVDGFDSEPLDEREVEQEFVAWEARWKNAGKLYRLGRDFRKQYVKEAA